MSIKLFEQSGSNPWGSPSSASLLAGYAQKGHTRIQTTVHDRCYVLGPPLPAMKDASPLVFGGVGDVLLGAFFAYGGGTRGRHVVRILMKKGWFPIGHG